MQKSVPADQQAYLIGDEKESLVKFDPLRQARGILKVFNRIISWPAGFFRLTDEEQREAGVYLGHHRHDE